MDKIESRILALEVGAAESRNDRVHVQKALDKIETAVSSISKTLEEFARTDGRFKAMLEATEWEREHRARLDDEIRASIQKESSDRIAGDKRLWVAIDALKSDPAHTANSIMRDRLSRWSAWVDRVASGTIVGALVYWFTI